MSLLNAPILAQSGNEPLGELTGASLTARQKASQYSFDNGGIGILISYGKENAVSAEEIGDAFVEEIAKRGMRSRYFFYNTDRDGMGMEFYIGYSAMGPWNVDYAASQVSKVVARAQTKQIIESIETDSIIQK